MSNKLPFPLCGTCNEGSTVQGKCYRITVLTSRLLRLEYSDSGHFEDRPTQLALNRAFPVPDYDVYETEDSLEIQTEHLSLYYDKKMFSAGGLAIKVRSQTAGIYSTWHYGDVLDENLGGTARTLDQADGAIPLEAGLQSRLQGFSVLDDSNSIVFLDNGWFEKRTGTQKDLYFWGYGLEYKACLRDFFHLSGAAPLLPRWTLGNWWSRFYPYTEEQYLSLMDRFAADKIPLSVAVIDMDWHITDVDPEDGKGWTGYTWNKNLFPDPAEFLEALHSRNLKVSLNDHPAEGIQPHEACYERACSCIGIDAKQRRPIPFDFTSKEYVKTYFEQVLYPLEQEGVDLWWVDWQQGGGDRFRTSDPLLLLNHFHSWSHGRNGTRPITFSRYAGPGSHRYPIGFSGDSIISWDTLDFQPYFTAAAANIGYGWWSHDIGGHCAGHRDEELMTRWVQFGVFSPIMRLHSTSNLFNSKEPWNYSPYTCDILKKCLQLRHQLIPYLYSANWQYHKEGQPLIRPMYYSWPQCGAAYEVPNQYEFGPELIVCPITKPSDAETLSGYTTAWLPEGMYYDFFTGIRYSGNRKTNVYRTQEYIPVFAPAGAIIPLTQASEAVNNGTALPQQLEIKIFCGKSGVYELYEDDGDSMDYLSGSYAITKYELKWNGLQDCTFQINPKECADGILPPQRQFTLSFIGAADITVSSIKFGEREINAEKQWADGGRCTVIKLPSGASTEAITISFAPVLYNSQDLMMPQIFEVLNRMKISYELKECIFRCIERSENAQSAICELQTMNLSNGVIGALTEILCAE